MTDIHIFAIDLAKRSLQICATALGGAVQVSRIKNSTERRPHHHRNPLKRLMPSRMRAGVQAWSARRFNNLTVPTTFATQSHEIESNEALKRL